MNGSTDIPTIQANIEWYLTKNYHGRIHAMNWQSLWSSAAFVRNIRERRCEFCGSVANVVEKAD